MGKRGKEIVEEEKAHLDQNSTTCAVGNSRNVKGCLEVKRKDEYGIYKRELKKMVSVTMTKNPHSGDT